MSDATAPGIRPHPAGIRPGVGVAARPAGAPMRVLFVFAWLVVGGEETEVRLLARNLDPQRYRLDVLSTYRRPNMPLQTHDLLNELGVNVDCRCYELPPEEPPPHIARQVRDSRYDID